MDGTGQGGGLVVGQGPAGDRCSRGMVRGQQRRQRARLTRDARPLWHTGWAGKPTWRIQGDRTGVSVRQPVVVGLVDDPGTTDARPGMGGQPAATVGADGVDGDDLTVNLQLDLLPRPDLAGRDGVEAGLERHQAVLADPAQVLVGDQIRLGRQRQRLQRGSVGLGPDRDHLAMGAVGLRTADRQPPFEGAVQLGDRVERPSGEHVVADDDHLAFHSALAGRAVGREHSMVNP